MFWLSRYFLCSCWWFSISSSSSFCWTVVSFFVWSNLFCNLFPLSVVDFIKVSCFFNANLWLLFSFSYYSVVWFFSYISSFLSLISFDWTCFSFFRFFISCFISAIVFSFTVTRLSNFSISVSFSESRSWRFSFSFSVMVPDGSFSSSLSVFNVSMYFSSV